MGFDEQLQRALEADAEKLRTITGDDSHQIAFVSDPMKKCTACSGRGYFHCECWPADCICGADYEPCEECGGDGWIDPSYDWDDIQYPDITPRDGETQE